MIYKERVGFYSKPNRMQQCIEFILFWNDALHVSDGLSVHHQVFKTVQTLYKFRTVFPSIIRCSRLYRRSTCFGRSFRPPSGVQDCTDAVHVSDGLSVHQQEFKTVQTLYMFRTAFPSINRSSRLYIKQ